MICLNLISTVAALLGVSIVWELMCKNSFAREILNLGKVTDNYIDSGIEHVYERFKEIDWNIELRDVKELTIFITYGSTWRNYNRYLINNKDKKNKFTVILPNFNNKNLIDELDRRFCYGNYCDVSEKSIVSKLIKDAAQDFKQMGWKVKLYDGTICTSYYLYGEKCICAPFKHDVEKSDVPAIKSSKGGTYYEFCKKDIDSLFATSKEWNEEENKN